MQEIIFANSLYGYERFGPNEPKAWIIENFLSSEMTGGSKFWISWIKNTKSESISGNITFIYKDEDKIYMMDLFEDNDNAPEFIIDQERLIYLLEKWDEFYKRRVPKIVLTFDDDYNFIDIYLEK